MANTLASMVVIGSIAIVVFLVYKNMQAKKKALAGDSKTEKAARKWMRENDFEPDHAYFFRGTGVAIKANDGRIMLLVDGKPKFHPADDIASIHAHETTVTRMVAAAPGVVRPVSTALYNINITFKNSESPACDLTFSDSELRKAWEERILSIIGKKAGIK